MTSQKNLPYNPRVILFRAKPVSTFYKNCARKEKTVHLIVLIFLWTLPKNYFGATNGAFYHSITQSNKTNIRQTGNTKRLTQ